MQSYVHGYLSLLCCKKQWQHLISVSYGDHYLQRKIGGLYYLSRRKEITAQALTGGQAYCLVPACPEQFGKYEKVALTLKYILSGFSKSF